MTEPSRLDDTGTLIVPAWPLLFAVVVVEAFALGHILPTWPGLTHEVALPPLDLTTDIGVILARATSVPWFVVGLLAALVGRITLLTCLLGPSRRSLRLAATFYLVALVPAYLAAQLIDASQSILYALLFWAGLVVAVLTALVLAPVPWLSRGVGSGLVASVRRGWRVPTVLLYLVALAVLGGLVRLGGNAAALGGVPVSAVLTFVVARRLARPGYRPLPFRLAGIVLVVIAVVALDLGTGGSSRATAAAPSRPGSLMVIPGIDTSSGHGTGFDLNPRTLGYSCADTFYFSYRGPGAGAPKAQSVCPIRTGAPYQRSDSERPLPELSSALRAQLVGLPAPISIVTHSSGSWIAWNTISTSPPAGVRDLIMLAPLTGALGYPPQGHSGTGIVGAAGTRLISAIGRRANFSTFNPDSPLASELLGPPGALTTLFSRPLHGVGALAVPAAYDLPLLVGQKTAFPRATNACPIRASHSSLVTNPSTASVVRQYLAGGSLPSCRPWQTWEGSLAAGFRLPDHGD